MKKQQYSYEELTKIDHMIVNLALATVHAAGADAISKNGVKIDGDFITVDIKAEVVEVAERLAETPWTVIMAYIQRDMDPVKAPDVPELDEAGVCPVCGGELEYGDREDMDEGGFYPWTCTGCGATGREGFDTCFDGHHYRVRDVAGDPIPGRND